MSSRHAQRSTEAKDGILLDKECKPGAYLDDAPLLGLALLAHLGALPDSLPNRAPSIPSVSEPLRDSGIVDDDLSGARLVIGVQMPPGMDEQLVRLGSPRAIGTALSR